MLVKTDKVVLVFFLVNGCYAKDALQVSSFVALGQRNTLSLSPGGMQ
jgi:hypothetical protein